MSPAFSRTSKNCLCAVESIFSLDYSFSPSLFIFPSSALLLLPSSLSSVTIPPSRALIISVHSSLRHSFLFSEPEAHSPSQAVSPHLCSPSSHQYPSTSPSSRKQSDPSVCCRPSASRLNAISLTLPLLWVNMTHASIILLSFCHYYAPWTSLHLSSHPFSSLLHSVCLYLSSLGSSYSPHLISPVMTNTSISLSRKHRLSFPLLQSFVPSLFPLEYELALSKHPSPLSVLLFPLDRMTHMSTLHGQK